MPRRSPLEIASNRLLRHLPTQSVVSLPARANALLRHPASQTHFGRPVRHRYPTTRQKPLPFPPDDGYSRAIHQPPPGCRRTRTSPRAKPVLTSNGPVAHSQRWQLYHLRGPSLHQLALRLVGNRFPHLSRTYLPAGGPSTRMTLTDRCLPSGWARARCLEKTQHHP